NAGVSAPKSSMKPKLSNMVRGLVCEGNAPFYDGFSTACLAPKAKDEPGREGSAQAGKMS
ncbi:MAG TPA: hypothetical protein IAA02_05485, partial [Candidatus Sutterella merdavium]|nr:hypothetical protein [Candidatus Sutterella merdavium]